MKTRAFHNKVVKIILRKLDIKHDICNQLKINHQYKYKFILNLNSYNVTFIKDIAKFSKKLAHEVSI